METKDKLMVYMLGGFELYYGGVLIQLKKKVTSKPVQLLQLLLYNMEVGVSRHAVLEALYGQETEIDAANSLNATVSQLRKLLRDTELPDENYIHVRLDRYYFESSFPTWVDTQEAVWLRESADIMSGGERQEVLYRLCDLYHGRFLPELDGETWVEIARAGQQRIYRDSLNEVCETLKEQRAYDEILRLTGQAARLFPFDEWQVWQQECLLVQGRILDAHNLYRQVEKLYMTELDAPPPERMRVRFRKPGKEFWRRTESVGNIQKWLEQVKQAGPYCIPFPTFLYVYNLIFNMGNALERPFCVMLCTMSSAGGSASPNDKKMHDSMDKLEEVLLNCLRWDDVFTRYSRNQFLIILLNAQEENIDAISSRISDRFYGQIGNTKLQLDCQALPAGEMPASEEV